MSDADPRHHDPAAAASDGARQGFTQRVPRAARILVYLAIALLVLWLLFFFVFPWVQQRMDDPALEGAVHTIVARVV